MDENEILIRALAILEWDGERLLRELNREAHENGTKISRATYYRWMKNESPINLGVKAFLRASLEALPLPHVTKPRPLTTLLMVSPSGAGRTPLSYGMAACASKLGVKAAVLEYGAEGKSFWFDQAQTELVGRRISRNDQYIGVWTEAFDLVFIIAPDIRELWQHQTGAATPLGQELLNQSTTLMVSGQSSDYRLDHSFEFARAALDQQIAVIAALGVNPIDALIEEIILPALDMQKNHADFQLIAWQSPNNLQALDLFRRCLEVGSNHHGAPTNTVFELTVATLESLGWEGFEAGCTEDGPETLEKLVVKLSRA